jgi:hypothetical protein
MPGFRGELNCRVLLLVMPGVGVKTAGHTSTVFAKESILYHDLEINEITLIRYEEVMNQHTRDTVALSSESSRESTADTLSINS